MSETHSNWTCVTHHMKGRREIILGKRASHLYLHTPTRLLHALSCYKFAAKLIGRDKHVLDIGCDEGLGTWILAKECGFSKGIDFDLQAIQIAAENFSGPNIEFAVCDDICDDQPQRPFDAIVNFGILERMPPEHTECFFSMLKNSLTKTGLVVIGTSSLMNQQFVSESSRKGAYSPEMFEQMVRKHFAFVFLFATSDEVIHTGKLSLAHYLIAVGCKSRA